MSASAVQVDPSVEKGEDQERMEGKYRELEPYQKELEHPKVCRVFKVGRFHEKQNEIGILLIITKKYTTCT